MMTSDSYPPLQLKGEIMDLDFTIDTDHRKRRRNRTTQSCLNCHTSKRKCDRKRPCQRCIQLGLTGLCVYEIDDPALRDDPTIDEATKLRNRIAELESLVRELRGKPHPRWAGTDFKEGDPNEKWHSRATKRREQPNGVIDDQNSRVMSSLLSPIKTEPTTENSTHLYRFSPSPPPAIYHTFQADVRGASNSSFDAEHRGQALADNFHANGGAVSYQSSPGSSPSTTTTYVGNYHHNGSSYSDNGSSYRTSEDGHFERYTHTSPSAPTYCPCLSSPDAALAYNTLSQQLESTLHNLRQYTHPPNTDCSLYRRIVELNNLMQYVDTSRLEQHPPVPSKLPSRNDPSETSRPRYSNPTSTTDREPNEMLSPLSASSAHAPFHATASGGVSPQEWNLPPTSYNGYFSMPPGGDQSMYTHVMS
ncbi:hypothetical protein AX16_004607 [Volvariella volvacea WC 439]|nr:hypothetical protein AX16_004607 [Volvariella volvacea WC 439]